MPAPKTYTFEGKQMYLSEIRALVPAYVTTPTIHCRLRRGATTLAEMKQDNVRRLRDAGQKSCWSLGLHAVPDDMRCHEKIAERDARMAAAHAQIKSRRNNVR